MQKLWKSIKKCKTYSKKATGLFFYRTPCIYIYFVCSIWNSFDCWTSLGLRSQSRELWFWIVQQETRCWGSRYLVALNAAVVCSLPRSRRAQKPTLLDWNEETRSCSTLLIYTLIILSLASVLSQAYSFTKICWYLLTDCSACLHCFWQLHWHILQNLE